VSVADPQARHVGDEVLRPGHGRSEAARRSCRKLVLRRPRIRGSKGGRCRDPKRCV
jgi:hypothetical protein